MAGLYLPGVVANQLALSTCRPRCYAGFPFQGPRASRRVKHLLANGIVLSNLTVLGNLSTLVRLA